MTVAHLVFSLLCTEDIFIGALLEERDTELKFGTPWLYLEKALLEYKQYKKTYRGLCRSSTVKTIPLL